MASERPFALLVSWTCYGTWLPGDRRGHASNVVLAKGGFLPKANRPGTPYRGGDAYARGRAQQLQKAPTVYLTDELALVVACSLCEAARKRGWRIRRGAVMANHVHVVVMDCLPDGPSVRRALKGASQADLNDHVGHNQRWWTAGGSDRYKNDGRAIEAAVRYVARQPGMLASILDTRAAGFTPAGSSPAGLNPAARPEMTSTRAAVLRLLHHYENQGFPLTLQHVHQLLYFLQAAGEPLRLHFTHESHGPHADNLAPVLALWEGHFTQGFHDGGSLTKPIRLIPNALQEVNDFAARHAAAEPATTTRLTRVAQLLQGLKSPYGLELLAGVHWTATHREPQPTSPDAVVPTRSRRPEHVRAAWQRLHEQGWLS